MVRFFYNSLFCSSFFRSSVFYRGFALFCLVVVSCDSGGPESDAEPFIDQTRAIERIVLSFPDSTTLSLNDFFSHSAGGSLIYNTEVIGPSVQATITGAGSTLELKALDAAGPSTIVVKVNGRDANTLDSRFDVEVNCSAGPLEQEASYFPIDVGTVVAYDYKEETFLNFAPSSDGRRGIMTWEILERKDRCTAIELVMEETFEGEYYIDYVEEGVPDSTSETQWNRTFTATLDSVLTIPGFTDQPPDEISVAGRQSPPLRWKYPLDAPLDIEERVQVVCFFVSCSHVDYTIRRETGFVSWFFSESNRFGLNTRRIDLRL